MNGTSPYFYLAARYLKFSQSDALVCPFGYCAFQAMENMVKAVAFYYDPRFDPEAKRFRHSVLQILTHLDSLGVETKKVKIPRHWLMWQQFTRYPQRGIMFGAADIHYLDKIVVDLVVAVPFQHRNSLLVRTVFDQRRVEEKNILARDNRHLKRLEKHLQSLFQQPS